MPRGIGCSDLDDLDDEDPNFSRDALWGSGVAVVPEDSKGFPS